MNDIAQERNRARERILHGENASKEDLIKRLAAAERTLDDIAQLALGVAIPPRAEIPPGELVSVVRALFVSGQRLAAENAQLRATLKNVL